MVHLVCKWIPRKTTTKERRAQKKQDGGIEPAVAGRYHIREGVAIAPAGPSQQTDRTDPGQIN